MVQNFGVGRTVCGATLAGAGGEALDVTAGEGAVGEEGGDFGTGFVPGLFAVLGATMFGAMLPLGAAPVVTSGTLGGAVSRTEGATTGKVTVGGDAADAASVAIAEAAGTLWSEAPRAFS